MTTQRIDLTTSSSLRQKLPDCVSDTQSNQNEISTLKTQIQKLKQSLSIAYRKNAELLAENRNKEFEENEREKWLIEREMNINKFISEMNSMNKNKNTAQTCKITTCKYAKILQQFLKVYMTQHNRLLNDTISEIELATKKEKDTEDQTISTGNKRPSQSLEHLSLESIQESIRKPKIRKLQENKTFKKDPNISIVISRIDPEVHKELPKGNRVIDLRTDLSYIEGKNDSEQEYDLNGPNETIDENEETKLTNENGEDQADSPLRASFSNDKLHIESISNGRNSCGSDDENENEIMEDANNCIANLNEPEQVARIDRIDKANKSGTLTEKSNGSTHVKIEVEEPVVTRQLRDRNKRKSSGGMFGKK